MYIICSLLFGSYFNLQTSSRGLKNYELFYFGKKKSQQFQEKKRALIDSGVARAFPGGQAVLPEDQLEEENKKNGRK